MIACHSLELRLAIFDSDDDQSRYSDLPQYLIEDGVCRTFTIYTTNVIDSINRVIRKALKKRKIFPSDDAAKKVVYLIIAEASKKFTMAIHNWLQAKIRFINEFGEHLERHI